MKWDNSAGSPSTSKTPAFQISRIEFGFAGPILIWDVQHERSLFCWRGGSIMIEVGKQAPDFELASHLGGTKFTLSQFKGQKNVMLVFYPLDWTPT
jgi:hypothetical protein